jgi:hypothetical protein
MLQINALRIWWVCVDSGIHILQVDQVYHLLCHDFVCPRWSYVSEGFLHALQIKIEAWRVAASSTRYTVSSVTLKQIPGVVHSGSA